MKMPQLVCLSSKSEGGSCSFDVDYKCNPTSLFKFIESKNWDDAKARIQEHPDEVHGWVTRRRKKDGTIRWKVLPLHAALYTKAPKDVVLPLIHAFPEACSLADDQGMLPLHLAMIDENIDDEVVKILLQTFPAGVNIKDKVGRLPIAMKGRPILWVLHILFASTLLDEGGSRTKEIKNLKE